MPKDSQGIQQITFAIEDGGDQRYSGYIEVKVKRGSRTCQEIANRRGSPEDATLIKNLNGIRNKDKKLKLGRNIKVPDRLRNSTYFQVYPGEEPPTIVSGYSKIDTVPRGQRKGLSVFVGYDPLTLTVPIRFEAHEEATPTRGSFMSTGGTDVEAAIRKLEEMAGRGTFQGNAVGPPAIIQVTTTDGDTVQGLIPLHAQRYRRQSGAVKGPVYWISDIVWGDALRNFNGYRIRQYAEVTLVEYVRPDPLGRHVSVSNRNKGKGKGKGK